MAPDPSRGGRDLVPSTGRHRLQRAPHLGSGQAPVKRYNRQLRDLIAAGKATPSWIVSHEISVDQAADAYKNFDARSEGWTKVLIKPGMSTEKKAS